MEPNLKYPIGVQSFERLRNDGYVYIDKTEYIHALVAGTTFCFLSRPRRFGKSLLVSTLEALFQGKRHLFKGLAIESLDWDWQHYEVIHLDFNGVNYMQPDALDNFLDYRLKKFEQKYSISEIAPSFSLRFLEIIEKAANISGKGVVILIDEYDKPMLDLMMDESTRTYNRDQLQSIYSVLKSMDRHIRFALVTGITRFSKVSIFSGANNLKDISLWDEYAPICGITENELTENLVTGINDFAAKTKIGFDDMLALLKENYDGYHFSAESPDIYNPFSLLNALDAKRISDYWFESGTPTYVTEILKRDDFFLPTLDCIDTMENDLGAKESYLNNPISLLFESGYMTIKSYDEEKATYRLGLPNKEVTSSFTKALLPIYSGFSNTECLDTFNKMRIAVLDGDADRFMEMLKTFLQGNPYSCTELNKRELYFQNNLYLILRALGFLPRAEEETCNSRIDVMLRTRRFIYIFELKRDGTASAAMQQIQDKGYMLPYLEEDKKIICIAANYSTASNNIDSWQIQQ